MTGSARPARSPGRGRARWQHTGLSPGGGSNQNNQYTNQVKTKVVRQSGMEIRARTKVGYNRLVQSYSSRPSLVQSTISVRTRKSTRKRTFNNRLGWVLTLCTRECSLLRCWSELAPFLHDQDDQRDTAVGRCRQRACEGRRSSQICSSSSGGAALADRGAAEELVDGIDPNARSSIAIPSRHHDWTAYGAACDVRSANAHADCTSVCRCVFVWLCVTAMLSSPTHGI